MFTDPIETAWLAGFLEGEGSFGCTRSGKGFLYLRVSFQTTDEDVGIRAAGIMGAPMYGPYVRSTKDRPARKPYWHVTAYGDLAKSIMDVVRPMMGARRRQQIDIAISEWSARPAANRKQPPDLYEAALAAAQPAGSC